MIEAAEELLNFPCVLFVIQKLAHDDKMLLGNVVLD